MRLYLLGGLLCIFLLQCHANPIIINADADSPTLEEKTMETKGETQEETTGVFKHDASESPVPSENQQTDMKEESNAIDNSQQAVAASTESNEISMASDEMKSPETSMVAKPKPKKKGKVRFSLDFFN